MVLAAFDQVVLEGVEVVLDGWAVELGGAVVDVLFVLSSEYAVDSISFRELNYGVSIILACSKLRGTSFS